MIKDFFQSLDDDVKGALLMVSGLLLVFHALGIFVRLGTYVLLAAGLVMVVYGFLKGGFDKKVRKMINGN